MSAYTDMSLQDRYRLTVSCLTRKRSRSGRWSDSRHIFKYQEESPWPATKARWAIQDGGPKNRDRWIQEFRHERRLNAINLGRDSSWPQQSTEPDLDEPIQTATHSPR